MAQNKVDETMRRIQSQTGVVGLIIINNNGVPIKTNLNNETAVHYAGLVTQFVEKSKNAIRELDNSNDLAFIRIHSKNDELMIAPDKDYILIGIQKTTV